MHERDCIFAYQGWYPADEISLRKTIEGYPKSKDKKKALGGISPHAGHTYSGKCANKVYSSVADQSMYITNIAKCTQDDARHLHNSIFQEYLPSLLEELDVIRPQRVFSFGNQVSSILLGRPISVSAYQNEEFEELSHSSSKHKIYPTYYPVGQGMRNIDKAIDRINCVLE